MKPRIAIVNSSSFGKIFPAHLESLNEFALVDRVAVEPDCTPGELIDSLVPYQGVVASVHPSYPTQVISKLPNLIAITRHGIGYNNIDVEAATAQGVLVTKVEGHIERAAVAELSISLLLSAARNIPEARMAVRENRWNNRASFVGVELQGKTIACIGLGNLGSRAAKILTNGFGARVLGCDPHLSNEAIEALGCIPTKLETALQTASIILLHCSMQKQNYHLINEQSLASMQDGVLIVNTARGELVDSNAMVAALRSGKVRSYAADVVEGEPIDNRHPLTLEPNAIIIPHLGGYTEESLAGMGKTMVDNMRSIFVDGVIPENTINRSEIAEIKQWR